MNLIRSWRESLALLYPAQLKPFLMVTAKTVLDFYKWINQPLSSRGNWIALAILLLLVGLTNVIKMFHLISLETFLVNAYYHVLFFTFLLGMRPSVDIKDRSYFESYFKRFWYLFVASILLGISYLYIIPLLSILFMLFLLFAFDGTGSISELFVAARNSVKMLLYNLPIFIVLYFLFSSINILLYFLTSKALSIFGGLTLTAIFYLILVPIEVALITNLYIKYLHGQANLYFKQPE